MLKSFLKGINVQRFMLATLAMFVFVFATDFVLHGVLLDGDYHATASAWRPKEEMQQHFIWMILGQFIIAKYFTFLFVKGYNGTGPMEGVRFGLLMGLFCAGHSFIQYSVSPITSTILLGWVLGGLLQCVVGGVLLTLVYKK